MCLLVLLVIVLLSEGALTAPIPHTHALGDGSGSGDYTQDEVEETLREGLLKNTENLKQMQSVFGSDDMKLCGQIQYHISCLQCEESLTPYNLTVLWTAFDPSTLAGQFVFKFSLLHWEVFGFEWGDACDLTSQNALILNITVSSLNETNDTVIEKTVLKLTEEIPSLINLEHKRIYASREKGSQLYVVLIFFIATTFATFSLHALYMQAKSSTKSTEKRKPKAYFQFWGFHIFGLMILIYTAIYTSQEGYIMYAGLIFGSVLYIIALRFISKSETDIETPTHCCRFSPRIMVCCHHLMLCLSVCILFMFTSLFLLSIPTILLIYYLNPVGTLLHLPLVINTALYTNSLLALFIYQCESCCHHTKQWKGKLDNNCSGCLRSDVPLIQKRAKNHDKYYEPGYTIYMQSIRPIFTIGILIIFLYFIYVFYQLNKLHRNKEDNFTVLLSLVPNLLLLFGSWYKLHLFWDFEKEKTEKEILKEILQHMKEHGQQPPTAIAEGNTDTAERYESVAATPTRSSEETEDKTQPLV